MNRYILFFVLISMQGVNILSNEELKKTFHGSVQDYLKYGADPQMGKDYLKELLEYKTNPRSLLQKIESLLLNSKFFEVYPHYTSPRHQETLDNIIAGKDHRGIMCPICSKSFEEIGNRVNLVCGHDICSHCLYARKYQNHCHECPSQECKHYINNADFPILHLKKSAAVNIKLLNSIGQIIQTAHEFEKKTDGFKYPYPNLENKHEFAHLERHYKKEMEYLEKSSQDRFNHFTQ